MERPSPRSILACYREFAPHPALQGRIRAFFSFAAWAEKNATADRPVTWQALFGPGDPCTAPLFADGNSSIVLDLGGVYRADGGWRRIPGAGQGKMIGAMSRVGADPAGELREMVGVYFQPAQVASFARVSASELTDRIIPLEDLWGDVVRELPGELGELDEAARIDRLESVLLRRIEDRRASGVAMDVPRLAAWALHQRGRPTVEQLAHAAGVSRQRLTRAFRERVGISPKLYCRLARFHSALAYVRRGRAVEWAWAAAELGYADQSHMIAEWREFSGLTPRRLVSGAWFHPFIERANIHRLRQRCPLPRQLVDRLAHDVRTVVRDEDPRVRHSADLDP